MDDIDPIVKKIQKINLATYSVFKTLCEENHLHFFAISGTALGVELWNGFIPWDDDMDIAMPIQDFEKFRKTIAKKLPEPYSFTFLPWFGGKVHNKNTTLIEAPHILLPEYQCGIFIDLVPLIGVPDDEKERTEFIAEVKHYLAESMSIYRSPKLTTFTGKTIKDIEKQRKSLISRYPFGTTKYCIDFSNLSCPLYLTKGFLSPKDMPFENTTIPTSSTQRTDLNTFYGTIIKHVPKEDRQLTHYETYAFCDPNTPYEHYTKSFKDARIPKWLMDTLKKEQMLETSNMREALLYKFRCQALEKDNEKLLKDLETILNSTSFKIGDFLFKPVSKLKKLTKKSPPNRKTNP